MSAEKLEPGWYWVMWTIGSPWEAAHFDVSWVYCASAAMHDRPYIIGPRIEPPGGE